MAPPLDGRGEIRMIAGLMLIFFAMILNLSMFSVAAPHIRVEYDLAADTTSWLTIAYTIPFILLMPLYGRLGDRLGKKRLLVVGTGVYILGSTVCFMSPGFTALAVGRIIQGVGSSAMNPLCLSIISEHISADRRGKVIGTWSTAGPFTGMIGPIASGLIIESLGWRFVFLPSVFFAALSLFFIGKLIPPDRSRGNALFVLRSLDWLGFVLLSVGLTFTVFFVSSRAITGRMPFTDWRMLIGAVIALTLFSLREGKASNPLINTRLFSRRNFLIASISVGFRMILLGGISFLIPLYVSELLGRSATETGFIVMIHAAFLFLTMRLGGILADRWSNRKPVAIGLALQSCCFAALAVQSGSSRLVFILIPLMISGAAAGLSLAALHHTALHELRPADSGAGAGLYSMIRFTGSLTGAAIPGIVLEAGLQKFATEAPAYTVAFATVAVAGAAGVIVSLFLREITWQES